MITSRPDGSAIPGWLPAQLLALHSLGAGRSDRVPWTRGNESVWLRELERKVPAQSTVGFEP
jgi:hypothetical protein